jgi:hypothetical protein
MPRTRLLPALALAATALAAPVAHADSISYVKDGNVYLTTPDGETIAQVTTTGGYTSASQADDGRIVALKAGRFHVMNRWGDVLADFAPVGSGTAGSITLTGPYDPAFSPDGTRIAYGFYVQYKTGDPNCGKPGGCMQGQLYTGVGYTRATGGTEWNEPGFQPQYSWTDPSWIDDQQVLLSSPTSALVKQVAIDTAGDGKDAQQWFTDGAVNNLYDGEMNRQRTAAAFVGNTEANRLLVYRAPGGIAADPVGCLDAPVQGGRWSSPTWAPSGERLGWAGPQGLYVATLAGIAGACPESAGVKVQAIVPGATSPDWGPADLPGPRPSTGGGSGDGGSAGGGTGGGGTPTPQPQTASPELSARATSRSSVLRKGLRISVRCQTGRLNVTAKLGKVTLATGRVRCTGSAKPVTLALTTSGRGRLKATRRAAVQVQAAGATPLRITLR